MDKFKVFAFGPPRILREGHTVTIRLRKAMALFIYLAVTQHPHSRDALATLLWPDEDQSTARANLRRALYRVNKAVGDDALSTAGDTIGLNPAASIWLDVAVYQRELAACLTAEPTTDTLSPDCLEPLIHAVELYTDDFLAGFTLPDSPEFDEWQFFETESLRQSFARVLDQLTLVYKTWGEYEEAIRYARRRLALDLLHEPGHRMLMELYAAAGQPAAALRQYQECVRLLDDELGVPPEDETTALYDAIKTRQFDMPEPEPAVVRLERQPVSHPGPSHNLPQPSTPFVGRERELVDLRSRLLDDPDCRLLTVTGPGGIGKTRLALETASDARRGFADGAFFISLAALTSAEHIVPTLAEQLGFRFYDVGEPRQQLLAYLQDKQMLLVLDNFEHVAAGADVVVEILSTAPAVRILATSRERLHLTGEAVYVLGGMRYPMEDVTVDVHEYGAVRLLLQRARLVRPGLNLQPDDLSHVARICYLVRGMPLALVLAASWLEVLSFREIADEIAQSLDFLEGQMRDLPARQQSVRAAFMYSWQRLSANEQRAFMRLSVFRGGFAREAAQAVAGAGLRPLRTLVNKSLVAAGGGEGRYEIHELLRQFGEEYLEASGDADATRDAHCDYFLRMLHDREDDLRGSRQRGALSEIEADIENIRVAWNWALYRDDRARVDAALESLFLFFYMRGRNQEGVEFLRLAQAAFAPASTETPDPRWGRIIARLTLLASHSLSARAPLDAGVDAECSLTIAQEQDNRAEIAFSLLSLGCYTVYVSRNAVEARDYFERSLAHFRALDDRFYSVLALLWIGHCHGNSGNLGEFTECNRQSLELARESGNYVYAANAMANLAAGAFYTGDYVAAETYAAEALFVARRMELRLAMAHGKAQLGLAHFLRGDMENAGAFAEESLALARNLHYSTTMAHALAVLGLRNGVAEEYELGFQRGEESLSIPTSAFGQILGHWALSIACCGLQEYERAWSHIRMALALAYDAGYPAPPTWLLPVAAVLYARESRPERAVELLALASTEDPSGPQDWRARWSLLEAMHAGLKQQLGQETFEAVWQRGGALDRGAVVADLLNSNPGCPERAHA